jgi:hypothetical protein
MKTKPSPVIDLTRDLFGGMESKYLRSVWQRHRKGAKDRGIAFDIKPDDVVRLYLEQGHCCAVTGLEFSFDIHPDAFVKRPLAPSIDRIISRDGYKLGNVRLVCAAINFGLGEWGLDLFMKLARAAITREQAARSP